MEEKKNRVSPINNPLTDEYYNKLEKASNQYEDWFQSQKFKYEIKGGKIIVCLSMI